MQPKSTITKFSIYLPTYNRHELVARTLESLSNQTYANFEVLLYDNGSDEPVKELVESYMDKRFIYTRLEKNQHTSDLAEDSLNRMSGTHFLFLADDDVLVPRALEIVAKVFHQHGVDILQTGYALFNELSTCRKQNLIDSVAHWKNWMPKKRRCISATAGGLALNVPTRHRGWPTVPGYSFPKR